MRNRRSMAMLLYSLVSTAFSSPACAQPIAASATTGAMPGYLAPMRASPQRQAAIAGLATLVARLPTATQPTRENRIFDVDDYRALRDATIGNGFEMYLVDADALMAGKSVEQSLYGSGEWRFIVMQGGRGVGLVTVAQMNGQWKMVQAGASQLADELVAVADRYARLSPRPTLRFIRCQPAVTDVIEVLAQGTTPSSSTTRPFYVPLAGARSTPATSATTAAPLSSPPLSQAELGDALRHRLQRGLRDPRFMH
ncbi:MAG: hypothetical protein KGQ57_15780 [Burkholderiales bacterium]|nr:hypothetical protein [Burkholderiales bacterium]